METLPIAIQNNLQKILLDLFAFRLCHQLPQYMSWQPDLQSIATCALNQDCKNQFCYTFPSFSLIGRVLRKFQKDQSKLITVTIWQSQFWYPTLLKKAIGDPFLLPKHQIILLNPEGRIHSLVRNSSLRLVTWLVSGKICLQREYQKRLLILSQIPAGLRLSSQKFLVHISSTSEEWKAESTLEPINGFEQETP